MIAIRAHRVTENAVSLVESGDAGLGEFVGEVVGEVVTR
jgi:hypothetical protein